MFSNKYLIQFYHDIVLIALLVIWLVGVTVYANLTNTGGLIWIAGLGFLFISVMSILLRVKLVIPETLIHVLVSMFIALFIEDRLLWFHVTADIIHFLSTGALYVPVFQ